MGFDLSLIFVPLGAPDGDLLEAVAATPPLASGPVAVLIGSRDTAPPAVSRAFPDFTALSLWGGSSGGSAAAFAAALSRVAARQVVVLTMLDHALVGGYLLYEAGALVRQAWAEGDPYVQVPYAGLTEALGARVPLSESEVLTLTEVLADPERGIIVTPNQPPKSLTQGEAIRVLEDDLPGYVFGPILAIEE